MKLKESRYHWLVSKSLLLCLFIIVLLIVSATQTASALTGLEIMTRVRDRYDGDNQTSDLEMILIDKKGNRRIRKIRSFKKDFAKDTYSIMFFLEPADVKNTGFLTYDYIDESRDEEQWLYLPALRKTKRIRGSEQSGSFMGSDFNYSDMDEINLTDYTYHVMKEPEVDGVPGK